MLLPKSIKPQRYPILPDLTHPLIIQIQHKILALGHSQLQNDHAQAPDIMFQRLSIIFALESTQFDLLAFLITPIAVIPDTFIIAQFPIDRICIP